MTRYIEADGVSFSIAGWARIIGVRPNVIWRRLDRGWDPNRAVTAPAKDAPPMTDRPWLKHGAGSVRDGRAGRVILESARITRADAKVALETKRCVACGEEKPNTSEFFVKFKRFRGTGIGLRAKCNVCHGKYCMAKTREFMQTERGKKYKCATHIRSRYGLSAAQFAALYEEQGGCCAACREPLGTGRRRHVDHDHATGQVRGILCRECNLAEGYLKGSALRARQLAKYLERNPPALLIGMGIPPKVTSTPRRAGQAQLALVTR